MPTFNTGNSARWRIFNAVATALETAPELQAVPLKRNPTVALTLKKGEYTLVVRWNADSQQARVGNDDRRQFRLLVGSIASTDASDRDADAMHQVVAQVLRGLMPTLNALTGVKELQITEQEVTPDLDNLLIEGALVLSVYEVTYRQPAFALR
jgi:hypothetical protein